MEGREWPLPEIMDQPMLLGSLMDINDKLKQMGFTINGNPSERALEQGTGPSVLLIHCPCKGIEEI